MRDLGKESRTAIMLLPRDDTGRGGGVVVPS